MTPELASSVKGVTKSFSSRDHRGCAPAPAIFIWLVRIVFLSPTAAHADQLYWVEQIAEGLAFPSSMAWLPSGEMLVAERMGGLRILRNNVLDSRPISGTPPSFQMGVTDGFKEIAVDPEFEKNQFVYLLLSEGASEERHAAIFRGQLHHGGLTHVARIFRSRGDESVLENQTVPSRMMFLKDKTLLVAVAEDFQPRAQRLDSHYGKILRINRDGSIPEDNPLIGRTGSLPEIWSYGHRTVLGLHQDMETGEIWQVEAGPRGGDELNVLKAGGNFGWDKASWGFKYNNSGSYASQSGPGIEDPILIWTPSVTPSGITRYHGETYPSWDGDYFVGHLTTKELERLRFSGHRLVLQERMLQDLQERIRDVKIGPDNYLYVLTDHQNGRVLRLRPGSPQTSDSAHVAQRLGVNWLPPPIDVQLGDPEKGRRVFLSKCAACHSVGVAVRGGQIGPDLAGVYGRQVGSQTGFDYSENMRSSRVTWDTVYLDMFLIDMSKLFPATRMTTPPVVDTQERRQIIGFLKQQSQLSQK